MAEPNRPTVGIVTVTYNSAPFFPTFMQSLASQTLPPDLLVLVDSGSTDPAFLDQTPQYPVPTEILREPNVGFSVGNNLGWQRLRHLDYILFLNPDAFLTPTFLETAIPYMQSNPTVGMLTPTLLRYDIATNKPLDIIDTTGVIRTRLGLLAERDTGLPASTLVRYTDPNEVPWLCAAVALARRVALESVLEHGGSSGKDQLFDESFFMYKEDTDLAWRIRRAGWRLIHHPALLAYHCRGWQNRKLMPRRMRLLTARNEIKMCLKARSPFVLVAALKYTLVALFNL